MLTTFTFFETFNVAYLAFQTYLAPLFSEKIPSWVLPFPINATLIAAFVPIAGNLVAYLVELAKLKSKGYFIPPLNEIVIA
jgi:hypothetical protein